MAAPSKKRQRKSPEDEADDPLEVARGIAETIRLEGRRGWQFREKRGSPAQRVTGLVECLERKLITKGQAMAGDKYGDAFSRAYAIGRYRCALAVGVSEEGVDIDIVLDAVHELHRARTAALGNDPLLIFVADHLCGHGGQLAALDRAKGVDDAKVIACHVMQALEAHYYRGRSTKRAA